MMSLYCFRPCAKAVPQSNNANDNSRVSNSHTKIEMNQVIVDILKEQTRAMRELMLFRDHVIRLVKAILDSIVSETVKGEVFSSQAFLFAFAQLLDAIVCIEILKNSNGAMSNDLSLCKGKYQF